MRWFPLLALPLVACDYGEDPEDTDTGPGSTPVCDGRQQTEEPELDSPFDQDGDGFFDASDPGCAETWLPSQLDCDDTNPDVNPAALELPCNGIDEDCNEASADNRDQDGDGVGVCEDCNDSVASVYPGAEEECFDNLDNDCDGIEDNDCGGNYTGTWVVTPDDIAYNCGLFGQPIVNLEFSNLSVIYFPPDISVASTTSSMLAGGLDGTVDPVTGEVFAEVEIGGVGACIEYYRLEGTFTSETTLEGTFTYNFTNSFPGACTGCATALTATDFTAVKQ